MDDAIILERLYDEHAQSLFAFLLHFTRNEADTRDLLQEVFCRLAAKPALLQGTREPRAFLIRMAHNLAIDHLRRQQTRDRNYDGYAQEQSTLFAATADPDESAFRSSLETALGELPEEQRHVVYLKLWEHLTFDAIADILGISPNTAASRYRYGLDKLREQLRPVYREIQNDL
jgi:RNA polymerase sigma-70 factor (ECF subfamily)